MNKKIRNLLVAISGLALSVGAAVGVGLGTDKKASEANAATLSSGSRVYVDFGGETGTWFAASANVYAWVFYETSEWQTFSYDSTSGYHYLDLKGDASGFLLLREYGGAAERSGTTWGSDSWGDTGIWNKSGNTTFQTGKNFLSVTYVSNDTEYNDWSIYEDGFTPVANNTATIYLRTPNDKCHYYIYTWESFNITVHGVSMTVFKYLNGSTQTSTQLAPTTSTYYNPANLSDKSSYGIIKASFCYNTLANVGVRIRAIQYIDGSYQFITKDLVVGATESNQLELVDGAYYYGTDDWNLWDNFGYDSTNYSNMGYDANVAYLLDTMDTCNLTPGQADGLRDAMDGNKGYLTNATWSTAKWGNINFNQAYDWVDSFCTTPGAGALSRGTFVTSSIKESSDSSIIIIITISTVALIAVAGYFFFRKRKED